MDMLRLSFVSSFALVLSTLTLGGCAADSEPVAPGPTDNEDVAVTTQALTLPPASTIDTSQLLLVMPECRAVLASTGPAVDNRPNTWGCASANPYVAQKRYAGELESGITLLRDQVQNGQFRCTMNPITQLTKCTRSADRLIEQLCDATLTYDCPCGVESVTVDGVVAAQCKRVR
jgi:hypothetical protein